MVIYGEYLFIENFLTGLIILYFTGKVSGEKLRPFRLTAAGIFCGFYAFSMFTAQPVLVGILLKLAFTAGIARLVFGWRSWRRLFCNSALFLAVTFLYGGIAIALLNTFAWQGAWAAEGVYLPPATYFTVSMAAIAGGLLMWFIVSLVKGRRQEARTRLAVTLRMGEKSWDLEGFVDSGNFLREPFSGKPVAVVRQSVMNQILAGYGDKAVRYMAIPYSSVGTEKGILDGYRIDSLTAGEAIIRRPVLAVCRDEEFLKGKHEEGQILLPESMLERGIYADFKDNQKVFSKAVWDFRKGYFLHRGKRRSAAAPSQRRGAEDAAGLCGGEPGGQSGSH